MLSLMHRIEGSSASQDIKDECFKKILQHRKDYSPSRVDDLGFTELHWAVLANQIPRVKTIVSEHNELINQGTQFSNELTLWHITPLMGATMHNFTEIVKILMEKSADPTIKTTKFHKLEFLTDHSYTTKDENPIDIAVRRKNEELLQLFSSYGYFKITKTESQLLRSDADDEVEGGCVLF